MLIRYPGSKAKHVKFLQHYFPDKPFLLCEPMAGAAALSFYMLQHKRLNALHLNDVDDGISAVWETVRDNPSSLLDIIVDFIPSVEEFSFWKALAPEESLEKAFRKIVLHQLSYSGLGEVAGGPIGGWSQHGKYKVGCRWNAQTLEKNIIKCHKLLNSVPVIITSSDGLTYVRDSPYFLYLDPPYYKQGSTLYKFGDFPHHQLKEILRTRTDWVLSYDNASQIHTLYQGCTIIPVDVKSHLHHRDIKDVIITP